LEQLKSLEAAEET